MKKFYLIVFSLLTLALLTTACGGAAATKVRISSKEFTEQYILGNMYQILLEDAGFEVTYSAIGGSSENHQALLEDQIDIYPEYTGTSLQTHLGMDYDPSMTASDVITLSSKPTRRNLASHYWLRQPSTIHTA